MYLLNSQNKKLVIGFFMVTAGLLAVATSIFFVRELSKSDVSDSDNQVAGVVNKVYFLDGANGNDSNSGEDPSAPLKTFSKANNILVPGDVLNIRAGTYTERLQITKSGTQSAPINIKGYPGEKVIIDLKNTGSDAVKATGTYLIFENLEVMNSTGYCVNLANHYTTFKNSIVHDCQDHGIYTDKESVVIEGNTVYRATLKNQARNMPSGFGSGIKVRVGGKNVVIRNNRTFNNYGEGIAVTRAIGAQIIGNTSYDNYNVNIYIDNSRDVIAEKNFVYCTPNSGFENNGNSATGFGIGEEEYSGWGAQLANITVKNNISVDCNKGITRFKANISGGGMDNVRILNNTLWGSKTTSLSLAYDSAKTRNSLVANNIIHRSTSGDQCYLESKNGITFQNNFWVGNKSGSCGGTNDKSGDIQFATGPVVNNSASFKLSANSQAVNAGSNQGDVRDDFIGSARDGSVDIGAFEYNGAPAPQSSSSSSSSVVSSSSSSSSVVSSSSSSAAQSSSKTSSSVSSSSSSSSKSSSSSVVSSSSSSVVSSSSSQSSSKSTQSSSSSSSSSARPTSNRDTSAPTLQITSPSNGQTMSRYSIFNIKALSSDNKKVKKVEFYVNGRRKCADWSEYNSEFSCNWWISGKKYQTYRIDVKAYDWDGNVTIRSVTVNTTR